MQGLWMDPFRAPSSAQGQDWYGVTMVPGSHPSGAAGPHWGWRGVFSPRTRGGCEHHWHNLLQGTTADGTVLSPHLPSEIIPTSPVKCLLAHFSAD